MSVRGGQGQELSTDLYISPPREMGQLSNFLHLPILGNVRASGKSRHKDTLISLGSDSKRALYTSSSHTHFNKC